VGVVERIRHLGSDVAIQELTGHATIDMMMRYAHLSPNVKKDAVRALDVRPNGTLAAQRQGA
jgi:integrase